MPTKSSATKPSSGNRKQRSYHRGNVREDLIALGKEILESEGINAITLRRLTRDIGVNPTNFYNHFANMDYLLAAVKADGFEELLGRDKKAVGKQTNKMDALRSMIHEHLQFAMEHPNLYRLMFDYYHDFEKHQRLKEVTDESMEHLVHILYGANIFEGRDATSFYKEHPGLVACWSLAHGLTHILIERQINLSTKSRREQRKFVDSVIDVLIQGIEGRFQI